MASRNIQRTSNSRLFTIELAAGPAASAVYQGLGRAVAPSWAGGAVTPIRIPSSRQYGLYEDVDEIVGQKGLPSVGVEVRMRRTLSAFLTFFQQECPIDLQIHIGSCTDPTDFLAFEKIEVLERARITNYSTSDMGNFDGDAEAPVVETLPFTGVTYYEIVPIRDSEVGESEAVQEIVAVVIPDKVSCGACGVESDGAQVILAVTKSHGGSPGLPAEIIFTEDGGSTMQQTTVDTLGAAEDPTDILAVGTDIVVLSNESVSLHYAALADILAAAETWAEVTTGFVALKGPNAGISLSRTLTWIVGDGGYIYFSDDVQAGVEVQNAGVATTENLNDIDAADQENLVAVGENNAVVVTANGGETWSAITGPNVGVDLTCVAMRTPLIWMVGDAGGNLWYTVDGGANWTAKAFTGSGAGSVNALAFADTPSKTVGYMAHSTAASVGRIFRTIDGGASWYRLPGTSGLTITAHDKINSLAVPNGAPENVRVNVVWAGGLADDASDGILLKIA